MSESHGDRAFRVYASEIAQIRDEKIKEFIRTCFNVVCPDYYWDRAASKGGMYHPKFAAGPGGLCRHTKYVCYWVGRFARAFFGSGQGDDVGEQRLFDCAMAAAIMHDMVKDGDPGRTRPKASYKMTQYHGVELMEAIMDRVIAPAQPTEEQLLILLAIASHMGVWTQPEQFRPWNIEGTLARKVATLVHMSDYAAAQQVDTLMPILANAAV